MTSTLRIAAFLLFAVTLTSAQIQATPSTMTANQIVAKWRDAVRVNHGKQPETAVVTSHSNQDGIPGKVEEWVTTWGGYRKHVRREFDEIEIVLTEASAKFRDWNGFVRDIQGKELERLRTEGFEANVVLYGPPQLVLNSEVSPSDDQKQYQLRITPPGGAPMTWFIDAKTFLPIKSVRPGDDSEITTTYHEWAEIGGVFTPRLGHVSETEKPEFQWRRTGVQLKIRNTALKFESPAPGPRDAFLEADAPPIPFTMEASHIVFHVQLNGREPMGFLLDTGADENVINQRLLAGYGLKPYAKTTATGGGGSAEYGYATGATFKLPAVELRNQHVAVIDQTGLERALGIPLGGILGYDFISRFVIEIDYAKKLITLHDPKKWDYAGSGFIVPVTFDNGIPFTHGAISVPTKPAISAYFVLDFGAADTMTLTSPFVRANDLLRLAQTNPTVNRPSGLENQFFSQNNVRGHVERLELGKLVVQSIPVNLSANIKGAYASTNFSGTVGETIFRRYHVFLDYQRNRVIFEPTAEAQNPFPERQTYGLTLLASGTDLRTFSVAAVRAGSPAEADGFKNGDVIAGMDAQSAPQFTLSDLRDRLLQAGEHHELRVTRGSDIIKIAFQVRLVSIDKNQGQP